uniref:Uncharacterized protein n=1 Tax=Arundo donax TaxID=35708 RepID=A0A0A9AX10_ARUDO
MTNFFPHPKSLNHPKVSVFKVLANCYKIICSNSFL